MLVSWSMLALTPPQFNNYISWYKEDKLHLRLMVYVLIVLTTLKCIDSWCV